MSESHSIMRQELYELVWSVPVSKLAPQLGLSDKGLTKKCKKHKIPTPPVGYWAKVESGKKTIKARLPKNTDPVLEVIHFRRTEQSPIEEAADAFEVDRTLVAKAQNFTWPTKINRYHPIVQEARNGVGKYTDKYDRISFSTRLPEFGLRVTKHCLPRALKFLEGIVRLFEECGWLYVKSDKIYSSKHKTTAAFSDGRVEIAIELKEVVNQVTKKADKNSLYSWDRYEYTPTGMLKFSILGVYGGGFRKNWKDSNSARIEEQLESIVAAFAKAFHYENLYQLEIQKQRQERQKQEEIRRERQRLQDVETKRRESLIDAAHKHREADAIRTLVESIQRNKDLTPDLQEWVDWALYVAKDIDPISDVSALIEQHKLIDQHVHNSWESW